MKHSPLEGIKATGRLLVAVEMHPQASFALTCLFFCRLRTLTSSDIMRPFGFWAACQFSVQISPKGCLYGLWGVNFFFNNSTSKWLQALMLMYLYYVITMVVPIWLRSIYIVNLQLKGINVLKCKHVITKQPTLDSSVQKKSSRLFHCLSKKLSPQIVINSAWDFHNKKH